MRTLIKNASLQDLKNELSRMLSEGMTDPSVRESAFRASTDSQDPITSVFQWMKQHTKYVPDPDNAELFTSPRRMIEKINSDGVAGEDCDGLALLTAAMLGSIGYKVRIALLDTDFDDDLDHAICQVYDENLRQWINVDSSSTNPIGWEVSSGKTEYVFTK